MRALAIDNEIARQFSLFVMWVKAFNAMNRTDINRVAQNVLVPILAEIYGYSELRNLDIGSTGNFPGIDLADDTARVTIQVTATPRLAKVKHTLEQFLLDRKEFDPPLVKRYDRVIVYILTERQTTYSQSRIDKLLADRFAFDASKDVWDYHTLLGDIQGLPLCKKEAILDIMKRHLASGDALQSEIPRRRLGALEELSALRRSILPDKWQPQLEWDDALEVIAMNLPNHLKSLRGILDREGAVLPGTVNDLLESAEAAAKDGSLEVSIQDTIDVPRQATRDAERMYDLLKKAIEELRASLASLGMNLD